MRANPLQSLDTQLGPVLEHSAGQVFSPAPKLISWVKEAINHLSIEPPKHFENEIPTPIQLIQWIFDSTLVYHKTTLKNTSEWAQNVESGAVWMTKWALTPLTFSRIGEAVQKIIGEKIVGNIVFAVCFCALQIIHPVPYLLLGLTLSGMISGGVYLYHASPIVLITSIASTIFLAQTYFLALLYGQTKAANKTLDEANNTFYNGIKDIQTLITMGKVVVGLYGVYYTTHAIKDLAYYALANKIA